MEPDRLPARVHHCYVNGIRSQVGQPKKWMDNLKEDIKQIQLNTEEAVQAMRDRPA